jgi:hypothetical protein
VTSRPETGKLLTFFTVQGHPMVTLAGRSKSSLTNQEKKFPMGLFVPGNNYIFGRRGKEEDLGMENSRLSYNIYILY